MQVTCLVSEGDLPITIDWSSNGKILKDSPEVSTGKLGKRSSFLTIESVSYANAGNYSCNARNAAGISVYTAELQVNGY